MRSTYFRVEMGQMSNLPEITNSRVGLLNYSFVLLLTILKYKSQSFTSYNIPYKQTFLTEIGIYVIVFYTLLAQKLKSAYQKNNIKREI